MTKLNARFNPLSLRFAATYRPDRQGNPSSSNQRWVVFRGAVDQELDPLEFYRIVGREDLAASYERRQVLMFGSYVVATFGIVVGMELQLTPNPTSARVRRCRQPSVRSASSIMSPRACRR
ncbi:MAG TPA: hypothetical protein VF516_10055 [Kofleriaceae bacterium]